MMNEAIAAISEALLSLDDCAVKNCPSKAAQGSNSRNIRALQKRLSDKWLIFKASEIIKNLKL